MTLDTAIPVVTIVLSVAVGFWFGWTSHSLKKDLDP